MFVTDKVGAHDVNRLSDQQCDDFRKSFGPMLRAFDYNGMSLHKVRKPRCGKPVLHLL